MSDEQDDIVDLDHQEIIDKLEEKEEFLRDTLYDELAEEFIKKSQTAYGYGTDAE